jgi:hypothetical protein
MEKTTYSFQKINMIFGQISEQICLILFYNKKKDADTKYCWKLPEVTALKIKVALLYFLIKY